MEQTQKCTNCLKDIPVSKSATHFGYCRRNIIKCQICSQMYDKNFLEEHQEQFHSTTTCKFCSKSLKKKEEQEHIQKCDMKPKYCTYCQLNVPYKQFNLHLKQCQSRTTPCELCEKSITNKDYDVHIATCKGKIFVTPNKNKKEDIAINKDRFDINDSLSQFWQKNEKQKQKISKNIKERDLPSTIKKESRKQVKQPSSTAKKQQKDVRTQHKKEIIDPKLISKQHFYDNYLDYSKETNDYADYDFSFESNRDLDFNSFGEQNQDYLPQQSFYGKDTFKFQPTPSAFQYLNKQDSILLDTEDQFIQQAVLQSSKKGKAARSYEDKLPADFFSEDIMNKSFYKDILDFQKQKAILQDFEKTNKNKAGKPAPPKPYISKIQTKIENKNFKKR